MPINLNVPLKTIILDKAKIANINVEINPEQGRMWVDLYVVFGKDFDEVFVQYPNPKTGEDAEHFHFETGLHPKSPNPVLGFCDTCGKKIIGIKTGECPVQKCNGIIQPYNGLSQLISPFYDVIRDHIYKFITTEQVPNLETEELEPILDGGD